MQSGGQYKRLTVREHIDRVRFDPTQVEKLLPDNGFKLIFPRAEDDTKYEKFQRKAHEIWQVTTGTVRVSNLQSSSAQAAPKKKKKPKKKPTTASAAQAAPCLDPTLAEGGDEGEDDGNISPSAVELSTADLIA